MGLVKKVGVAGAGAMGLGIAQVFAQAKFEVVLFDVNTPQLEKAKAESRGLYSWADRHVERCAPISDSARTMPDRCL